MITLQPSHSNNAIGIREEVVIGRGPSADIRYIAPTISRQHCALKMGVDGSWFVHDLESTNGTKVNGVPLLSGTYRRLEHGDVLRLADTIEFVVRYVA